MSRVFAYKSLGIKVTVFLSSLATLYAAIFAWPAVAQSALAVDPAPKVQPCAPQVSLQKIEGGYAIVVSRATESMPDWAEVVETLQVKYGKQAQVITWDKSVTETRAALAGMAPRYTCFVARWEETGREFVADVHRLTRNLNDDPYPDTIWGILTGYDASDAKRIASTCAPLVIHSVVSTTGVGHGLYDDVFTVSDGAKGMVFRQGKLAQDISVPEGPDSDRARSVVEAVHQLRPDMMVSSSHACENILEMPFSHGAFIGLNGNLIGVPTAGDHGKLRLGDHGWAVASPNPKVWLAAGNCLAGHICNQNSIALAMMRSAGVTQMVGYTVTTWYGAGGWGVLNWIQGQPGRFSLAESFFINDVAITRRLAREYPGRERFAVDQYDDSNIERLAQPLGISQAMPPEKARDLLGLTWDHDTVAFYGDPAWDARIAPHPCAFDQALRQLDNGWALDITARQDGPVTAFAFLPKHIDAAKYQTLGDSIDTLLTGTYLLANLGPMKKGELRTLRIETK